MKYIGRQRKSKEASKYPEKESKSKEKKRDPDWWKKNTPGLQKDNCRAPPSYPPLEMMRQAVQQNKRKKQHKTNIKIRNKIKHEEPTKLNKHARHPHDRATFRKNKNERKECQQNQN